MKELHTNPISQLKALLCSTEPNNWQLALQLLEGLKVEHNLPTSFLSFLYGVAMHKHNISQQSEAYQLCRALISFIEQVNPSFDKEVKALNLRISLIDQQYRRKPEMSYPLILEKLKEGPLDLQNYGEAMAAQSLHFNYSFSPNGTYLCERQAWKGRFLLAYQYFNQEQFEEAFLRTYGNSITKIHLKIPALSISTIPAIYLENIAYTEHVSLNGNQFEELPRALYDFRLKTLSIRNNPLKTIAPACQNWQQLEHLSLFECRELQSIPKELGKLKSLKIVELSHCRLVQVPMPIFQLQNLESLTLSQNKLIELPKEIEQLQKLKILSLHQNSPLKKFPEAITEIPSIVDLRMNECNLLEIPEEIAQLQGLHNLSLSYNSIKKLPNSFSQLKNLKTLKLSGNPLDLVEIFELILALPKIKMVELLNIFSCSQKDYAKYSLKFKERNISVEVDNKKLSD